MARDVVVRPMREADLEAADRIFRLAFGTFLRLPDPTKFAGDSDWIGCRWRAEPEAAFVAERDGVVVGSNLMVRWGSVGFFGPLSVHPDLWDQGVARRLLEPTMERFAAWGTTHAGLFTFAESAKHVALYGTYGFHPRFLTAIMARPVVAPGPATWTAYSKLPADARARWLDECRQLTEGLYPGLDVTAEITALAAGGHGDTVLATRNDRLAGVGVCHVGTGSEAGGGYCYVKFGAVRSGASAEHDLGRLLDACGELAVTRRAPVLMAGTNLAREGTYRYLVARGFRTIIQGVAMHRPNEPGYSRPDVWALDDWR
jgi:predicted N-acetyltransferase YhbS